MSLLKKQQEPTPDPKETQTSEDPKPKLPEDRWLEETRAIRDSLSVEDLIFLNEVKTEVEIIPGKMWATFKSLEHDVLTNLMTKAVLDTSGQPVIAYESHYAVLTLSESIRSIRTTKGDKHLPLAREEKYAELRSFSYTLLRRLIDKYNQFDAAIAMLVTEDPEGGHSVVGELKK